MYTTIGKPKRGLSLELLHSRIKNHALKYPERIAYVMDDLQLNYSHLFSKAQHLAVYFQHHQLYKERIVIHLGNSIELAVIYLGCFMAGAIVVPLNINLKKQEIQYIIEKTSPKLLISENFESSELKRIDFSKTSLKNLMSVKDLNQQLEEKLRLDLKVPQENDAAAIFFTSGSTAKPKGVVHSQRSFVAMLDTMTDAVDLTSEDRFLVIESMSNASGCIHTFMAPFVGGVSILTRGYNSHDFLKTMAYQPTCTSIMGKANYDIVHDRNLHPAQFKGIKFNFSGGDKITADLMQRFQRKIGVPIRLGYGMSEFLIFTVNKSPQTDKMTSVGQVAKGVEIRLLDQNGMIVPDGEIGEVWARGPNCMLEYWQDPKATSQAIVDGWLRTGDLARVDSDGYYWFMGRLKHIIIREGSNISPLEVEEILSQHPAIHAVAVIGIPKEDEGEVPAAFVELNPGHESTEQELMEFVRERLENYKVPVSIKIMKQLPRTLSGKISRIELKKEIEVQI